MMTSVPRREQQGGTNGRELSEDLTVLDVFCGAGGFSEGFRSAGFRVVAGIDHWRPAVDTFNCNFGTEMTPRDVLSLERRDDLIEQLPDTDVIIGSPPCVSFSYSNKFGNADKTEGIRLIKLFFAIVAIKKFKPRSRLLAWYMENVTNVSKCLPDSYSFRDLGLSAWATRNAIDPNSTAITIKGNTLVLNASDFGVAQTRKRLFVREIVAKTASRRAFPVESVAQLQKCSRLLSARSVRSRLPAPTCKPSSRKVGDPYDKAIQIPLRSLTDHFYENGAYAIHWRDSKRLKTSHPYMGKMSFPENEAKPSRTVMATPFPRSREALLYKSEWKRKGDGEYRGPTVREAACLMSFPITYQFVGSEGAKWKLVGNAVCPRVSRALAAQLLRTLGLRVRQLSRTALPKPADELPNLNTFSAKKYDNPPKRKKLARFRSHPLKAASMTVALTNYDVLSRGAADGIWRCFVTYGIGEGYKVERVDLRRLRTIKRAIEDLSQDGRAFVEHITNGFSSRIPPAHVLQRFYEDNVERRGRLMGPNRLLQEVHKAIEKHTREISVLKSASDLFLRDSVPVSQLFALFAVGHIVSTAKMKRSDPNE